MVKKKETRMSARALNRMIRTIVGSDRMYVIETLVLAKSSKTADPVQYSKKTNTVVINCPTNTLTIVGSFPDLLSGMVNLKRITKNIGIEVDQHIRSQKEPVIKDEMYPDTATVMYSTQIKEDIIQVQNELVNINGISTKIAVHQENGAMCAEIHLKCDVEPGEYIVRYPIKLNKEIDSVRSQKNRYTQIIRGFSGTVEKFCCVVSVIERNVVFVTINTPTEINSYVGKLVLAGGYHLTFENTWGEGENGYA